MLRVYMNCTGGSVAANVPLIYETLNVTRMPSGGIDLVVRAKATVFYKYNDILGIGYMTILSIWKRTIWLLNERSYDKIWRIYFIAKRLHVNQMTMCIAYLKSLLIIACLWRFLTIYPFSHLLPVIVLIFDLVRHSDLVLVRPNRAGERIFNWSYWVQNSDKS